ncbi:heterokaryon incompatibility protein-domain-containing protein [Phyllosticta capitalensis]|uniref:Heterokaryon incompatibility protein-domain-containing protein n=1 Tax=Phyllosticta capitalensis TaxID=121624 RepID=A0ABR1YL90_9PEZI
MPEAHESFQTLRAETRQRDTCQVCDTIWEGTTQHPDEVEGSAKVDFGSVQEALSNDCPGHKPLIKSFASFCNSIEKAHPCSDGSKTSDAKLFFDTKRGIISLGQVSWWLCVAKKDDIPRHPGQIQILDPNWVNVRIVKGWKRTCVSEHGKECQNPTKIWPVRPAWLIDVVDQRLVSRGVAGDAEFVALSYTYGNQAGLTIDADVLADLQRPGALATSRISSAVAPIIKRAMYLTAAIGERFLWADALCIPHVDPAETKQELELMGAIYANALVVIIAADGTARDGLKGLKGVSEPRHVQQTVIPFRDDEHLILPTMPEPSSNKTQYYSRGWTYQEELLAKRTIEFDHDTVFWHCQYGRTTEDRVFRGESGMTYMDQYLRPAMSGYPHLLAFAQLIIDFNMRSLRHDDDALPAISGLLAILSRCFDGGFLYGIPETCFERGLGWKPLAITKGLRRRKPSNRPEKHRLQPSGLPSWSWIGWSGLVDVGLTSIEAVRMSDVTEELSETIPITKWYTGGSPREPPSRRRRIKSTWFETRESRKDFSKPLPAGWTRFLAPSKSPFGHDYVYPDGCGEFIFKHVDLPSYGLGNAFYYPFPVASIDQSTPPIMPPQTEYLFCKTTRAHVRGRPKQDAYGKRCNMVGLFDGMSNKIGDLYLSNSEQLTMFEDSMDAEGEPQRPGTFVELVAIYRSRHYPKSLVGNSRNVAGEVCERYQVLWIKWEDEVAYRLATGHVDKEAWENLELEEISLVLG